MLTSAEKGLSVMFSQGLFWGRKFYLHGSWITGGGSVQAVFCLLIGMGVGIGAAFSGLGGGFLMVPLLLFLGYSAQKAVGTSFMAILIISISALFAHGRLDNIDYRTGVLLGLGGMAGAQIGARLLENVSTGQFRKIFALVLVGLAGYLFFKG